MFCSCKHYWYFPLLNSFHCQSEANNTAMLGKLMSIASKEEVIFLFSPCIQTCSYSKGCFMLTENLPDAGKAQDFMKKFNQVLGEDEKLRLQLEMLISPTCSCKQAETCVVSRSYIYTKRGGFKSRRVFFLGCFCFFELMWFFSSCAIIILNHHPR